MKKWVFFLMGLIIFAGGIRQGTAQTFRVQPDRHSIYQQIEARKQRLLQFYAARSTAPGFFGVMAKLATKTDISTAYAFIDSLTANPHGDMFFIYPLMATYLYFQDILPEDVKARMKSVFHTYTPYRGDTENHWLMYYTSILLAAQTWPGETGAFWFNGKSSEENYKEAKSYLESWIKITTTIGQGEFDSPDYGEVYLSPLFLLYEFSREPEFKLKAKMILDWFWADYAPEYLKGMFCGGHSRIYEPQVYDLKRSEMSAYGYLYFGGTPFNPKGRMAHAVVGALSLYHIPFEIVMAARDRSEPYVHTETKRVRNIIRHGKERNPPVYKYDYMTKDYCLGSLQGGILQPIQQHTWDVSWVSDKPYSTIFSLHPTFSSKELSTFFPEEEKIMVEEVIKSKGTYNRENKWTGGSPYEFTFQYKNSIIVLYDIPKNVSYHHIDTFFPKNLDTREEDASGWIFCSGGNVYVAYLPFKPHKWIEESIDWRLRSFNLKNGLILEVDSKENYPSFKAFKNDVRRRTPDLSKFDRTLTVQFRTPDNHLMKFGYPDRRFLNGAAWDFSRYKLFHGPFTDAAVGSQKLTIHYKNQMYRINFLKPGITQWIR